MWHELQTYAYKITNKHMHLCVSFHQAQWTCGFYSTSSHITFWRHTETGSRYHFRHRTWGKGVCAYVWRGEREREWNFANLVLYYVYRIWVKHPQWKETIRLWNQSQKANQHLQPIMSNTWIKQLISELKATQPAISHLTHFLFRGLWMKFSPVLLDLGIDGRFLLFWV